ncbi:MAG: hypothetical protein A2068_04180 [Ignavibacteria bacterium GWB2_35_6b]|nr:MAG: hypothetical protein A2068_04180 [Ignavibacteria bacterium GWB2_35_6b]
MFEREIKFIYDFNLNKVKKTGSFLTYKQLLAADLHPAIMQYISAEIDYLIFEDRQKMLKNSVFDYSGGKITQYFNLISQEVKKSKRFSTDYISKLILHASSFTVNFLIRPKWSLLKFIYDEEEHKTSAEIKQILNYLYYYGYLKNILVSYLDKKKILSMNKEEFADLLDKIEKLGVETYLDDVLNTALKSMAEFFNIGTTQKTKVPLPGIYVFLKEKKLTEHINRLNNYFGSEEKINQELKDIQKVLGSLKTKQKDLFEEINEDEIEEEQPKLHEEIIETQEEEFENKIVSSSGVENEEPSEVEAEKEFESFEKENGSEIEKDIEQEESKEEKIVDVQEQLTDETEKTENKEVEEGENEVEPFQENTTVQNEDEVETEQETEQETQSIEEELEEKIEEDIKEENETISENPAEEYHDDEDQVVEAKVEDLEEEEPTLFGKEELQNEEETEDNVIETQKPVTKTEEVGSSTFIDMSAILEHKNMTKIIENIFDYDMEDFANTIDMISECASKAEALAFINDLFENNNIKTNSKEAETFKSIISEYFDKA